MDAKELKMPLNKKRILCWALFFGIMFLGGCETTKGLVEGIGTTAQGAAKGAAKDTAGIWQGILKADNWIKENLW